MGSPPFCGVMHDRECVNGRFRCRYIIDGDLAFHDSGLFCRSAFLVLHKSRRYLRQCKDSSCCQRQGGECFHRSAPMGRTNPAWQPHCPPERDRTLPDSVPERQHDSGLPSVCSKDVSGQTTGYRRHWPVKKTGSL